MKQRFVLIITLLILSTGIKAQLVETIYQGSVAQTGYVVNGSYGPFNIGFNFTFFGNTYSQFYINSNGLIQFGEGSTTGEEVAIPNPSLPNNFIAAFWDDLVVDPYGGILYTTIGAAPNRKLIVQFRNMGFYPSPVYLGTFSVILYETTNKIQVQYRLLILKSFERAHGGSATIGIENSAGDAGVQYAYHDPDAVESGKAITFTPDDGSYSIDTDAIYDGIFLTTNITLPEPGITPLISPADEAVIGVDHVFEWAESTDASFYSLKISPNPTLGGATNYDAGSNLTYSITGLVPGNTYYWAVFASNATGFTWCEVKSFTVSETPPLAAVPRTIWIEQGNEGLVKLQYTGGDAGAKTATITSLPQQGHLFQVSGGVKGALIDAVPAAVTDPEMQVIYVADGENGNGAGSFSFMVSDATGDSPVVTFTINVNPPGVPNFILTARSANAEIQFDRPMADPAGKQDQFTVTVDGSPVTISSAILKNGDSSTIVLILETPLTGPEEVFVSYTQGNVAATSGGLLASFTDQSVTLLAQTITFAALPEKRFGDSPFTVSATTSSGLGMTYSSSNLPVATISGNNVTIHSAGTSVFTARQAGNATYAPARYLRTLTVVRTDLTFTAEDKTKPYLDPLPDLTYTITGFVSGETQAVLDVLPVIGTTALESSPVDEYPITLTGGSDNNYNYVFVEGVLTITKIDQIITFTSVPQKLIVTKSYSLAATSTSGLAVLFESLNPQIATVTGNQLTGVSKGIVQIRAYNAGDQNYNPGETTAAVEIESTHRDIMSLFTPNNDGFNDLWEIPDIATYGKCDVRIYNRWGKLVFSSPDYDNTWNGRSNGADLPEGAYYYVIKTQNSGTITGTVNIVR